MQKYVLQEQIGSGGYSSVYKCSDKLGIRYACKVLPMEKNKRHRVQKEIDILEKLVKSTRVARIIDACEDSSSYYIIEELCKGGGIKEYLGNYNKYSENTVASIIRGVLRGLYHIHEKGIIHRDIKSHNILFSDTTKDSEIKIVDFGAAIYNTSKDAIYCEETIGTPWYMAPETINHMFAHKSDVWSVGILTYNLLSGDLPFDDEHRLNRPLAVFKSILTKEVEFQNNVWNDISPDAIEFIKLCLQKEYQKRPCSETALLHKWLTNTDCSDRFKGSSLICRPFVKYDTNVFMEQSFENFMK